jgi:SulP family sulfate permease
MGRLAGARIGNRLREARAALRGELKPSRLVPSLLAGLLVGLVVTVFISSFASLIFSGPLAPFLPRGIGIGLLSVAVVSLVLAVASTYEGHVSNITASPVLVLSLITQAMIAGLPAGTAPEAMFRIAVVTLGTCSLGIGIFLFVLGHYRLGGLIRYIPFPVIGGLLAGTGWLLVRGGLQVMTGMGLTVKSLAAHFATPVAMLWVPGVLLGALIIVVQDRLRHYLVLPSLVLGAVILFHAVVWTLGLRGTELVSLGWLMQAAQGTGGWSLPALGDVLAVDWGDLFSQVTNLVTLLAMQVITMLLYLSALELEGRRDIDFNHELKWTGVANAVVGMGGGIAGAVSLASSNMVRNMGAPRRLAGALVGVVCLVALVFGDVFRLIPKLVFGAILITAGFGLMKQWLLDARAKLPWQDYCVILLIMLVMSLAGFIQGVGVGVTAGLILFVVNYSRIDVVKHSMSGGAYRSNVDRSEEAHLDLSEHGDQIYILRLQGFIFFGTAVQLVDKVNKRMRQADAEHLRYLIMDFRAVTGLDSSSVNSFLKLVQYAEQLDFDLVFTGLTAALTQQLTHGGLQGARVHPFSDLQRGLQWSEDHLLMRHRLSLVPSGNVPLLDKLTAVLGEPSTAAEMVPYLERRELDEDEVLIRQGDPSDDLFFIESGRLRVELESPSHETVQLRTLGAGTFVGEVAFYLRVPRSASVVADQPAVVYRLTEASLETMKRDQPQLASALHAFMAGMLAQRLADTDRLLQEIID